MTAVVAPARPAIRSSAERVAIACTAASAAIGAAGVVFLAGMFTSFAIGARSQGLVLGGINDVLVLVSYALAAPAVIVLRGRVRPSAPLATDAATVVGLVSIGAIVMLQAALVRGVLTFEQQIGPVSIAFLAFAVWLVAIGRLGSRSGLLPGGVRMGLLGATYVGYPVWAAWAARRLGRAIIDSTESSPA